MSETKVQKMAKIWEKYDGEALEAFCGDYRSFITEHKTERE